MNRKIAFKQTLLFVLMCLFLPMMIKTEAKAASIVEVKQINYDEAYMLIEPNGNTKVYYSDAKEEVWNEVEGKKLASGYLVLDISWISVTSDYELHLKGDDVETVVSVTLPKQNKSFSVSFDKLDGILIFENEAGAKYFEWRKSTAYDWSNPVPVSMSGTSGKTFLQQIEELRVKGAKIYVRLPQTVGNSATSAGKRQSKEVLVTIPKRNNAPSVTINSTKLTLNTKTTQEYKVYSIGGTLTGANKWLEAEKNMSVTEIAPYALYTEKNTNPRDVIIAIRTKETEKATYSKTLYLTIPAQETAPKEYTISYSDTQYLVYFSQASKYNSYQYCVVKEGKIFNPANASWKSVSSAKTVTFSKRTYPEGSKIYIRKKGNTATSTVAFSFPSMYVEHTMKYSTVK